MKRLKKEKEISEKKKAFEIYRGAFINGYKYGQERLAKEIEAYIAKRGFRDSNYDLEQVRKWIAFLVKGE